MNVDDLASSLGNALQLEQQPTPIELDEALPYIDPGLFAPTTRAPAAVVVATATAAIAQKPAPTPAASSAAPVASSAVVAAAATSTSAAAVKPAPLTAPAAAAPAVVAPPRRINFPQPLSNPLQQPIPTALKTQMAPPPAAAAAAAATKRTQPALHPDTLKDNRQCELRSITTLRLPC